MASTRSEGGEVVTGTFEATGTITAGNIIKAAGASGIALQDDGGNFALTVMDGGYLNNATTHRVTGTFSKTNNTLADVTGLSIALPAAGTFRFHARIWATSPAIAGVGAKFAIAYSGTSSLLRAMGRLFSSVATTLTGGIVSAAGTVVTDTGSSSAQNLAVEIEGVITTTGAGNLTIQFAQNTTNATASTVLTGSNFEVWQIT